MTAVSKADTDERFPACDRPAMGLGGAVVDPERAHLIHEAAERRFVRDAEAAAELDRPIDHAVDRLRHEGLGDRRLVASAAARVEHPHRMADERPRRLEVDRGVRNELLRQAEIVQALPEQLALARVR